MRFFGTTLLSAALAATHASAGLAPVDAQATTNADGSYHYSYNVVLTSDSTLNKGDYFSVYDFNGYVANSSTQPTGWALSYGTAATAPSGITPTRDATKGVLTWTYLGDPVVTGRVGIGAFTADSTAAPSGTTGAFTSRTQLTSTAVDQNELTSTVTAGGSTVTGNPVPGVPEPSTLLLGLAALPLAFFARRRFAGAAA